MRAGPDPPLRERFNALVRLLRGEGVPAEELPPQVLPAVTVRPDPSRYGAGIVRRRASDGALLYDSPRVGPDGKRPTHRLAVIAPRLAPGQTIDELEQQIIDQEPAPGTDAVERSLEMLDAPAREAIERLLQEAARAGVRLRVSETRRPQARQDALFRQGRRGQGYPVTWTLTSNHQPGNAADLLADTRTGYLWIQENAPRFGLGVLGMGDPGHVEFRSGAQRSAGAGTDPELGRLERALRAAHAAGDETAARRLAAALAERRASAPAAAAPTPTSRPTPIVLDENGQPAEDAETVLAQFRMSQGGSAGAEGDAENTIRLRAQYDPAESGEVETAPDSVYAAARGRIERGEPLTEEDARLLGYDSSEAANADVARERAQLRGRESVRPEDREGFNAAAVVQGIGSGLFGIGTPATAVGEMLVSRMDGEPGTSTWNESLGFARGRRDQLRESHPQEFYGGVAGSLLSGIGAARGLSAAGRAAPRAASVFALQSGQTARNIARLSATGAAAAGVTALNEEGVDAVPGAAVAGAVAGPALAGAARVVRSGAGTLAGRIRPDNPALRLLAQRLGEPVSALQQRYDDFVRVRGRPPRLAEIVRQETSEEFGQISRTRSEAGGIFRQAEEDAARALPNEMSAQVQGGGVLGNEPAAAAGRVRTTRTAAGVVGRRVQSTPVRQIGVKGTRDGGQRGRSMDALMGRIGEHRVPVTDAMLEVVEDPDLMGALEPAVRRGVRRAIEAAGEGETPYLRVRDWDTIRRELGRRAGTENGRRYAQLRNEVRDYVSAAVPEYGAGLREFARRTNTARGTAEGFRILSRTTREFVDRLRTPTAPELAGVRVGARTALANALSGDPAKAERFMETLARDAGLRERVRLALRPDEVAELERLAERYGQQLDFSAGLRTGRSVLRQNDTEAFQEAVAQAGSVERVGVRQGTRAVLTEAAGESPAGAARTALRLAEDPGLQTRIFTALGAGEQRRLTALGQSVTESSRRLAEAAPGGASLAATRAQENAENLSQLINVVAASKAGGAFRAHLVRELIQKARLPRAATRRLAELATDPARAHMVIARLRRAGVEADEILRMYQSAAAAAGVMVGRGGGTPENTTTEP